MKIKEYIIIDRSKEIVWEHIHDPRTMQKWNPRVLKLNPDPQKLPGRNYKFEVTYEMLGKPDNFSGVIIEYETNNRLMIRYRSRRGSFKGFILESFQLKETRRGTKLCHGLDFKDSGLNFFIRFSLYFIGILSRPIGKKYLSKLKTAVEC